MYSKAASFVCRRVARFRHMGWNRVEQRRATPLFDGIPDGSHFYFVHSYFCDMAQPEDVVAVAEYGTDVTAVRASAGS